MKRKSKFPIGSSKIKAKGKMSLAETVDDMIYSEEDGALSPSEKQQKRKYFFTALAVVAIVALAFFKFSYVIIPAKVGNQPIFIWSYLSYLHKNYGKEGVQRLTTQALINQEIAKSGVVVKQEEIQKEIDLLDKQASASGGIKATLAAQQMTIEDLRDQLRIQLAVKQILKDKISVTDQEVIDTYKKNRDFFKGIPEAEAKLKVKEQLENQKFQTEATAWLAEIRKNTPIQILFPAIQQPAQ